MKFTKHTTQNTKGGFTLIEMIVAVGIFAVVMLMATSAIFTVVAANAKAQSLKIVMDNLDFALQSMVREIRVGSNYTCPDGTCPSKPDNQFSFYSSDPGTTQPDTITYALSGNEIVEYNTAWTNSAPVPITAANIDITSLNFYLVTGTDVQPRVLITVGGSVGTGTASSTFDIQTTVSQRGLLSTP